MPTATIVKVWTDRQGNARVAAVVDEGGTVGRVEYIGVVPADDWAKLITNIDKKTALTTAAKAARDAQTIADVVVPGISGTIAI